MCQPRDRDLEQLVAGRAVIEEEHLLSDSVAPKLRDGIDPEVVVDSAADEAVSIISTARQKGDGKGVDS